MKINCNLKVKQKLEFSIIVIDSMDKLWKIFARKSIKIGDEVFDKKYMVQSPNSNQVLKIFSNDSIRSILLKNNVYSILCNFQKTDSKINLLSVVSRTVNSKSELSELYKLLCLTIDKIIELD